MKRISIIFLLATFLLGCSGAMNGMIRNDGSRVSISYKQGMDHDDLKVTMPDGETFTGKVVMVGASSGFVSGSNSASIIGPSGGYAHSTGSSFAVVNTYTGIHKGYSLVIEDIPCVVNFSMLIQPALQPQAVLDSVKHLIIK